MTLNARLFSALLFSFGLISVGTATLKAQGSMPDGPGKEIIQEACTVCHAVSMITETRRSPVDWGNTIDDMIGRGAPLMEGERALVMQYLARNFGPDSAKINVNRATSKQIETDLSLTAKEAEEIVRYREQNGNFKTWEDLGKVPGVDLKKVEAKKDRVSF